MKFEDNRKIKVNITWEQNILNMSNPLHIVCISKIEQKVLKYY